MTRTPGSVTPTVTSKMLFASSNSSKASVGSTSMMMSLSPFETGVHCQFNPFTSPGPRLMVWVLNIWPPALARTCKSSITRLPMLETCAVKVTCSLTCGIGSESENDWATNAASGDKSSTPAPRIANAYVCSDFCPP